MKKERRRNRELRRAQRRQARIDAGLVPSSRDTPKKKADGAKQTLKDKFATTGKNRGRFVRSSRFVRSWTHFIFSNFLLLRSKLDSIKVELVAIQW